MARKRIREDWVVTRKHQKIIEQIKTYETCLLDHKSGNDLGCIKPVNSGDTISILAFDCEITRV